MAASEWEKLHYDLNSLDSPIWIGKIVTDFRNLWKIPTDDGLDSRVAS